MELLAFLAYFVICVISLLSYLWYKRLHYFSDRGMINEKPDFPLGNLQRVGQTQDLRQPFYDLYRKYKNTAPVAGFYLSMRLGVVIFDLDLIKNILIKDFNNFSGRGNYYNEKDDPISGHIFNLEGPKWRKMRAKLTPTFTSGKMKFMFPTVVAVAEKFIAIMQDIVKDNDVELGVEVKDLVARFTTDVIGTCAFGLECNSLKDPNTQFREMGKKVFARRSMGKLIFGFIQAFPNLSRKLHLTTTPSDVSAFFLRIVRETVAYREREGIRRNDFLDLLIELKKKNDTEGLTIDEIAAQVFVFFLAGFETSSSTMGFSLYELAVNQDIQDKARAEINSVLERHDGKLTYEGMQELKYIQQIFQETLRKYSIASILLRKTIKDYHVPGTKFVIEKDVMAIIPVDAIHRDPDIYPNPDIFDPDRFTPEEVHKRHPMTWLPFGEGPRNCIGLRFGEMQSMIGLAMLLKHFKFSPSKETPIPLVIKKNSFVLASEGGIVLKVESLK